MKTLTALTSAAILGLSMTATAVASPVYFKSPISFAGTGCPAGSVSVTGENSPVMSILFDQYDAGSDAASGQRRRASCSFAVPIHVPQGWQVSTMTADWQVFTEGRGQLKRKYFFAGEPFVPWLVSNFNSPNGHTTTQRDNLIHSTSTWSKCGRDVNLRISSEIRPKGRNSYIAADSVDLQNKLEFHLQWRQCR